MSKESMREEQPDGRKIIEARALTMSLRLRLEPEPGTVEDAVADFIVGTGLRADTDFRRTNFRRDLMRQLVELWILAVGLLDAVEDPQHPAMLLCIGRQVSRDQQRRAVGSGETGEWPSSDAEVLRRGLIVTVNVGALVGVDLHRHEV